MGACLQLPGEFLGWKPRLQGPETSKQIHQDGSVSLTPVPGARGAPAFEHIPLAPGFINTPGNEHGGDSSLQHGPAAHRAASQGPSPLPEKSGVFLGSETSGPSGSGLSTFHARSCRVEKGSTHQGAILGSQPHLWLTDLGCHKSNLLTPQHLKIPQISVNLKSRHLPNT